MGEQHCKVSAARKRLLAQFIEKWNYCDQCSLSSHATNYVWFRGSIPADLLFIGEAPGNSEDATGTPFIGPSGKLLDQLLADTFKHYGTSLPYAITNTVSCIPLDSFQKIRQPTPHEVTACSPRLVDFIELASPRLIVFVGEVAKKLAAAHVPRNTPTFHVKHPAYLLRNGARTDSVLLYKQWYLSLSHFLKTHKDLLACPKTTPAQRRKALKTQRPLQPVDKADPFNGPIDPEKGHKKLPRKTSSKRSRKS